MDIKYKSEKIGSNVYLYEAEIIANAFSKALEDNNCLIMLPIGLHREIEETSKDLEEMDKIIKETEELINRPETMPSGPGYSEDATFNVTLTDIRDSKSKCFRCNLKIPKFDFELQLSDIAVKLKNLLKLYKDMFKIDKLDLCQVSFSFQRQCVPDIIGIIVTLLTAYCSIMALKKLSNLSITAFIKGIVASLLGKLIGSVKISVNIGGSNIHCLINMLKEIAESIPTQENIAKRMSLENNIALGIVEMNSPYQGGYKVTEDSLVRNQLADEVFKTVEGLKGSTLQTGIEFKNLETDINEHFSLISKTIDSAVKEVNNYVQSLLSFQTYLECEAERSGMGIFEAIEEINNLIATINLLSAIALSIAKKNIREEVCKTSKRIKSLSEDDIEDLYIKDVIQDLHEKDIEIVDSSDTALQVILKERPSEKGLPKIDLFDCSIDYFVESHTLPNILLIARKQVEEEIANGVYDRPLEEVVKEDRLNPGDREITFKKPSGEQLDYINNLVDLIAIIPEEREEEIDPEDLLNIVEKQEEIENPLGKDGLSYKIQQELDNKKRKNKETYTSLQCRSIDDVLDVLNNIRKQ